MSKRKRHISANKETNIYLIKQACLACPHWKLRFIDDKEFARITNTNNNKIMVLKVSNLVFIIEGAKMCEQGWYYDTVQKYFDPLLK